jgi:hypothetical protein
VYIFRIILELVNVDELLPLLFLIFSLLLLSLPKNYYSKFLSSAMFSQNPGIQELTLKHLGLKKKKADFKTK